MGLWTSIFGKPKGSTHPQPSRPPKPPKGRKPKPGSPKRYGT